MLRFYKIFGPTKPYNLKKTDATTWCSKPELKYRFLALVSLFFSAIVGANTGGYNRKP